MTEGKDPLSDSAIDLELEPCHSAAAMNDQNNN